MLTVAQYIFITTIYVQIGDFCTDDCLKPLVYPRLVVMYAFSVYATRVTAIIDLSHFLRG